MQETTPLAYARCEDALHTRESSQCHEDGKHTLAASHRHTAIGEWGECRGG